MIQASLHGRCCCQGSESLELPWLLLLSSPDDHHSGGVRGGQQAFVAVEAHVQDRPAVALQLVNDGLSVAFNVEKVDTCILTASDYKRERAGFTYLGFVPKHSELPT